VSKSIFWHDYETFGVNPQKDRPSQFAGIRTDYDLNIIDKPVTVFCKTHKDMLPHPQACLITGITPQYADKHGVSEAEFSKIINKELTKPETVTSGFNSIRFDGEVTRNVLYRNFIDPYEHEWKNENSRWDVMSLVQATYALRPDGINWPTNDEGQVSFKLTDLTKANNISHENAHDAMSDVYATIAVAKLIKETQPKLYNFIFNTRLKTKAANLLVKNEPVLHVSSLFGKENNCISILFPLADHPTNKNAMICWDLNYDPRELIELGHKELKEKLFTGELRGLFTVHKNKAPVLAPVSVLRGSDKERLALDVDNFSDRMVALKNSTDLWRKIPLIYEDSNFKDSKDPDLMIYSGGFFTGNEKNAINTIRRSTSNELKKLELKEFPNERVNEMFFRYKARNFPEILTEKEIKKWDGFCKDKLQNNEDINFKSYFEELESLKSEENIDLDIIESLIAYGEEKMENLSLEIGEEINPRF